MIKAPPLRDAPSRSTWDRLEDPSITHECTGIDQRPKRRRGLKGPKSRKR